MAVLRSALLALSRNRPLRGFLERSRIGTRLSARFAAGTTIKDALDAAEALNRQGLAVTLDSLGENVTSEMDAHRAAEVYLKLLDAIAARKLNAHISVKLTQIGLEQSPCLAETIASSLAARARAAGSFVRVDMEGSSLTQTTLDTVRRVHARANLRGSIGAVVQAYLYRSESDIEQLLAEGIPVRLCKGAYKESAEVAFPRMAEIDRNFMSLSRKLLDSPVYAALATHDENLIAAAKAFAAEHGIGRDRFEFQMLYGIRRDLQRSLVEEGYRVRVYLPFGPEWYPYFMRRLAERPANILFLARNFFR